MVNRVAFILATWFGAGLSPKAPGTVGTLATLPLAWAVGFLPLWQRASVLAGVSAIGVWAASHVCRATGVEDNQKIVIDESAGLLLTVLLSPNDWRHLALGVVLFRLFDIWKPPPVRTLDRRIKGGLGVMLDDLAAGVYGLLVMALGEHFHIFEIFGRMVE
jgi:phosphatidylglycerophosphatase A